MAESARGSFEAYGHRFAYAKCRGADPFLFVADELFRDDSKAKAICRGCPIRLTCLEYALDYNEEWGIWGGLTEIERKNLRKARIREDRETEIDRYIEYMDGTGRA